MKTILQFLCIITLSSCPLEARKPTCEDVLANCREVTAGRNCQCKEICAKAIVLCEGNRKHEAEALLDECKINCVPKKLNE